ncbi:MAG: oligoendopeptidase F, partial [Actinobacteria bacterium]|nr:oligoendopeptidase F [Actinomycetota bacterium]
MNNKKILKKREDIPEEYKWNLGDIYIDNKEWEKDYRLVKDRLASLGSYRGRLKSRPSLLTEILAVYSGIMEVAEKLFAYAHMKKDGDNTDTISQALLDRAQSLMVETQGASSFIIPEILKIPVTELKELKEEDRGLKDYMHFLDNIERQREHVLTPEVEKILALSGEIAAAPEQIFNMINNADIRFPFIKDGEGNEIEVTKGRYNILLESRNRRVRKDAFNALYGSYEKQKNTIASTLNYSIKKDVFISRVRNYPSCLHAALFDDNIPCAVYDNLISAVNDNLHSIYRYVSLRKKILGVKQLHMYDLYVPVVEDIDFKVSYAEAK